MGSGESRTRKVSFGVDDEDRVRILRGVKLSEDVLQRMKGVANIAPETTATTSQKDPDTSRTPSVDSQTKQTLPASPKSNKQEEQKRFEEQQQFLKDELSKVAQKEAVIDELAKARSKEKLQTRREAEKAKVLAEKLQKKDSQLRALEAFYKAQIAQLEKRNREEYEQSKEQFHQAASKTEEHVRPRNTEPVCTDLQAQILSCYRDNKDQTLRCSDLAKEYMKCIQAAKKNLMVNHG
ncbi:MICOS complex subunit mic25a isoform X2 [Periophthalmus magnuspinnatus]|uniref:MICOS complex subunit mic25a isoform X2 n=1 Tax=Periophthalmus magnuspinnatus TaxID=409849 RepID=UPI00145A6DA9|nr:MICOS complex subunit mic25a isoform X2 [Periophthalmus magnuspinnatus]